MPESRRVVWIGVAVAIVLLIVGYAIDSAVLIGIVVIAVVAALVAYALRLLMGGQLEWFKRDQDRRNR